MACLEEQLTVAVAVANSMVPNHTIPGGTVTAYSHAEVTKDDELVCVGNHGNDSIQVFLKLIFDLVWVGHGGGIGAGKSGKLLSM